MHNWVVPGTAKAYCRVQLLLPLNFAFLVLSVDPDCRYVLFGYADRSLGRIFLRAVTIDNHTYASLLKHIPAAGYDISLFRRVVELPTQIGQPSFGDAAGAN